MQHIQARISFEVISRCINDFPERAVVNQNPFLVTSWGKSSAEEFSYSTRGAATPFVPGTTFTFSELLESMMPKFLAKVKKLPFESCIRDRGTWRLSVSWRSCAQTLPASSGVSNTLISQEEIAAAHM